MRALRLVLSRRAGFDLQGSSLALNGLPAHSVARPGKWGNPFTIATVMAELGLDHGAAQREAVGRYRRWLAGTLDWHYRPDHRPISRRSGHSWVGEIWPAGARQGHRATPIS